jgi:hypothetical protein
MDGQFARTYNMVTRFGDLYDHATDMIVFGLVFLTLYQQKRERLTPAVVGVLVVALAGTGVSVGCQQRAANNRRNTETLDALLPRVAASGRCDARPQTACPSESWIHWTRFLPSFCMATGGGLGRTDRWFWVCRTGLIRL